MAHFTRPFMMALFVIALPTQPAQSPASIQGMVLSAGTSTPVIRGRVDLRQDNGSSAQSTTTDAVGKFELRNLPPGHYRVFASRDGFVPGQYGERSRGGPGATLTIESGQQIKDMVIALTPRSALSGRVYDRYGDPVVNETVQALRYAYQDGRRILIPVDAVRSNDRGEYRLFWLIPGQYIVSAARSEPAGNPDQSETYLPVYYPGTTDASAATLIDVPAGINLTGVDLGTVDTRAARVRGRVINGLTGQPVSGISIMLVPRRGTIATGSTLRTFVAANGTFEFRHMAPGSYYVVSTANIGNAKVAGHTPIDVASGDVDNVNLALQPQLTIAGRVVIDGMGVDSPVKLDGIRVELRPEPFTPELLILLPTLDATGAFTLNGVTPGDYQLRVRVNGMNGYVKSARYGAIDALNPPFRIDTVAPLEIAIDLNAASVDCIVVDEKGLPYPDATVVLVPDAPRRQRFDLYYATGSNTSGQLHFSSVAPGDYRAFAWEDVPSVAWQDPDFIRVYEGRGTALHVSQGSRENIQLKVISSR
jgi:hypothetical protein